MNDYLGWLQQWFAKQCNGEWEHGHGIKIGTLDNPGWWLEIDIAETILEHLSFDRVLIERKDDNWISYEVKGQKFVGHGGPLCLNELARVFKKYWDDAVNQ